MRWHLWDPDIQIGELSGEVLCFILEKQMHINNFSGCVFTRQTLRLRGAKESIMHTESKFAKFIFLETTRGYVKGAEVSLRQNDA